MLVFLDFEASSLGRHSYPIEIGWVFEDGSSAAYLIRPAPDWTDWDPRAEAIHHIPRDHLLRVGAAHDVVANAMVAALSGHDLVASAPSWDGKWLSTLLRAAGLPRHSLRLRSTDDVLRETAFAIVADHAAPDATPAQRDAIVEAALIAGAAAQLADPAHRALADAQGERDRWLATRAAALHHACLMGAGSRSIALPEHE